jgi:hypothetical protein
MVDPGADHMEQRAVFKTDVLHLAENNFSPKIVYPAKLSLKIDEAIKIFHNKWKLKPYMTMKPLLQKILQGIMQTEDENKQNHMRTRSIKLQEKKRQAIRE